MASWGFCLSSLGVAVVGNFYLDSNYCSQVGFNIPLDLCKVGMHAKADWGSGRRVR